MSSKKIVKGKKGKGGKVPFFRTKQGLIALIVMGAILLGGIVTGTVFGIKAIKNNRSTYPFPYETMKLDKYVRLDASKYQGITVSFTPAETVTDDYVKKYIAELVSQNVKTTFETSGTVADGDLVQIFYRGQIDGKDFIGGSNMTDENPTQLTIGSGAFIPGFEEALIGAAVGPYYESYKPAGGAVAADGSVYLTYTYTNPDTNKSVTTTERVTLNDENSRFSASLRAALVGKAMGNSISGTFEENLDVTGDLVPEAVSLSKLSIYRVVSEDNAFPITVTFPDDYKAEDLQGKEAVFYVYIRGRATAPTADYKFITETLKLDFTEDLLPYVPADKSSFSKEERAVAAFPVYVKKMLETQKEDTDKQSKITAMWNAIMDATEVVMYPDGAVDFEKDSMKAEAKASYAYYVQQYGSYTGGENAFIREYYGIASTADLEAELTKLAKEQAKRYMSFYYVIQQEDLALTHGERRGDYNERLQGLADYYTVYYGTTITTDEVLEQYGGKQGILFEMLYEKASEAVMKNVTFKEEVKSSSSSSSSSAS